MSYNSFSRPRFYTNNIEHLYNRGFVDYAHPVFLSSSWHRPKTVDGTTFTVDLSRSDLLSDISYIMILGNVEDNLIVSGLDIADNAGGSWGIDEILDPAKGFTPMVTDTIPANIFTFSNFSSISQISITVSGTFSGIAIGSHYDLPYNPDLGIKKSVSYSGVNTYDSIGGKTLSSNYGSSRPFNPFPNRPNADDDLASHEIHSHTGRRSYDISYSYIGSDSLGQNHLFPKDFNHPNDIGNLSSDLVYDESKKNLYTSVINKTIGSHIPFIFSLDGATSTDLMLARFKDNSFEATEQAPNVHNISFGIREVW